MDVLNIYLSLNIFVNISYHSRISSLRWSLLNVMILLYTILKPLAVIFTVVVQVVVDNLSSTQLDIILISAELHHSIGESLTDAGQELLVVLRVQVVDEVIAGLVVALPFVASQVAGVRHQHGWEGKLNCHSFFRDLQQISLSIITALHQ